jgi:hypothetical protein
MISDNPGWILGKPISAERLQGVPIKIGIGRKAPVDVLVEVVVSGNLVHQFEQHASTASVNALG